MIRAKIIGAGGYGGVGATELLLRHPEAEIAAHVDVENIGVPYSDVYPHLRGFADTPIVGPDDPAAIEPVDVVFMATPDGVGMKLAPAEVERGAKVIDYSGDFRFQTVEEYAEYASRIGRDTTHASPDLLQSSVYGLSELRQAELTRDTTIVGNPGCFAVSVLLGLSPAVKAGLVAPEGIICDAKTGVSGAGKKPLPTFHYPARYDHMNAYKLRGHQHVCEIEQELSRLAGREVKVTFTAQVVPVCRGIMSTLYGDLQETTDADKVLELYRETYRDAPFVRVYDWKAPVGSAHVRGSNYCNLVVSVDTRTAKLRVVSYIDNLVKGQAGSAIQNMNLIFGLDETAGLDRPAVYP